MSSPLPIDPYEVLNVARHADLSSIRAAHRKLVLKHHPDRIKDETQRKKGTEEFQKAQQAYELLCDEKRRARYDDQVRLAQLKKEAMMERGVPLRSTTYSAQPSAPPRTTSSATYEFGRVYEERRPSRYSDEDDRYAEPLRSARKTPGYERRPSTAYAEEKKKKHPEKSSSIFSSFADTKLREKAREARERAARAEATKARDRERRQASSDKYARRAAYVEDDSSSDSDTYVPRRPEPPRRKTYYDEPQRRRQDSPPARKRDTRRPVSDSSSSDSDDDYDSYNDEWLRRHADAKHYISERSTNGRPSVLRTDSAKYYAAPRERSSGRKSGSDKDDRRDERPKTSKTSRPEVVEPPRRSPQSRKAPPMTTAKSSPAGLKGMTRDSTQPQRSATGDYPTEHKRTMPSMSRSNTMPIPTSRKEPPASRSSKLKQSETHDSGYGSSGPVTPELHGSSPPKNPKTTTSKFFIVEEDPEHSRSGYRTVPAGETYSSRRTRSPSPLPREREREERRERDKKRPERPTVQTNSSHRSTQYTVSPEQLSSNRPPLFRADSSRSSARDPPPLSRGDSGGRRTHGNSSKGEGYSFKPENVRYSPQLSPENIKYARRHASELRDRDYFPGSSHHDNIHTPKSGRRESIY